MVDRPLVQIAANDFARQWRDIRDDALGAVDRVGQSGWLVLGKEVEAFEAEFAANRLRDDAGDPPGGR